MTPRERALTLLRGGTPDRVPWFGDLDYWATAMVRRGERPKDFKSSDAYIRWHRDLGVGFYMQGTYAFKEVPEGCSVKEWRDGDQRFRRIETPKGTLQECWLWSHLTYSEAPLERLVKSEQDLAAYRYFYEHLGYEPNYGPAERRRGQVAEMGLVVCYTPHSPFMNLVAVDSGIENIVTMVMNAPEEFEETLRVMKRTMDRAVEIALKSPAEILMIPENLSSEVVGPTFFEQYMKETQTDWVNRIRAAGKFSSIHMDGTLKGLLRQEARVGFTYLEALTPAPTGDLPVEAWADYFGDSKTVAWGGVPGAYFTETTSDAEFDRHVISVLEVMRRAPRYVLGVADQVPPDGLERRVRRAGELVEKYGAYAT